MKQILFILAGILALMATACKKDSFITSSDANIRVTADTLYYDTVFTSTGSITQVFKIINENDRKLKLDAIALGGGGSSYFKINADGITGPSISNIEIAANDSIYVFATVSIDASAASLPFVVRDSIQISYNGNRRLVQLEAYGQNAHFLRNAVISSNVNWPNDLPYVILGGLLVQQNARLTLQRGVRLYFHSDAPLIVDGALVAQGTDSTGRIRFRSDRLDEPYAGYPGSWPGIYFRETSGNNVLQFVAVENAYQGLIVEGPSPNANPKLTLSNSVIDNIYDAGILGIRTSITASNCLISNAGGEGSNNLSLVYGGNYDFTHCTVATYGNSYITHKNPVLNLSNYIVSNNIKYPLDLRARFRNCIFWGENGVVENEVNVTKDGNTVFDVQFSNCLYKVKTDPANVTLTNIIKNEAPAFDSIDVGRRYYNFRLKAGSPAINKGIITGLTTDLDGRPRVSGPLPDLGAYERP